MQASQFTKLSKSQDAGIAKSEKSLAVGITGFQPPLKSPRGFVFSVDAAMAVLLLSASITFLIVATPEKGITSAYNLSTLTDDAFSSMERTGYIISLLDSNAPSSALQQLYSKAASILPSHTDIQLRLRQFDLNSNQCKNSRTFSACFEQILDLNYGNSPPIDADVMHREKFFVRRLPPGDCNLSYLQLKEFESLYKVNATELYFSAENPEKLFFQSDINFNFDVNVSPSAQLLCDENITVTLTITSEGNFRHPIDVIIVLDQSRPFLEYGGDGSAQYKCRLLNSDKNVMNAFLHNSSWLLEGDMDRLGVDLYSDDATTGGGTLVSNLNQKENAICNSSPNNPPNAIAEGIELAIGELTKPSQIEPTHEKFIVLLSDGLDDSDEADLSAQVNSAKDENITIFTVGIGATIQADSSELQFIADGTGGEYYFAEDQNALADLYEIIANRVIEYANDTNVVVPWLSGATIIDLGGGILQDQNLVFEAGSLSPGDNWSTSYILNFPCNNNDACAVDALTLPGEGSYLIYLDQNGISHTIDFDVMYTIPFLKRDITLNIYGGEILNPDEVVLDVNVQNIADLNTPASELTFRLNDINGELLVTRAVPELCGSSDASCSSVSFQLYPRVEIAKEGVIYAIVNEDNSIRECPNNNYKAVNCYGGQRPQYFVLEYSVWRE